jgi:hypothetical protein
MDAEQASAEVQAYWRKRHEIRVAMLHYLREHQDVLIPDGNLRRKLMYYPSDLSDIRLALLVDTVANK